MNYVMISQSIRFDGLRFCGEWLTQVQLILALRMWPETCRMSSKPRNGWNEEQWNQSLLLQSWEETKKTGIHLPCVTNGLR